MRNLAIIPARSGSKELKDKNIRLLAGKPLLAYTIEAAIQSKMFTEVHVSTDSEKYADIARSYGANVPFLRPKELSTDNIGTWEVVRHIIKEYEKRNTVFDTATVLQPTSPLRDARDIQSAFSIYKEKKAESVMSVCEMEHTPLWANILPENHSMKDFIRPEYDIRRQELPTFYRQNGAIYIQSIELILQERSLYGENSYAYIMSLEKSVDIDNIWDFRIAEMIMDKRNY